MLINEELFNTVEQKLIENGTISDFEKNNGKIKGRMMITTAAIPDNITIENTDSLFAFECSFDFYDSIIGIAIYVNTLRVASPLWVTPQIENAEEPAKEWVEFFLQTLTENIAHKDSFGIPMYTFVNDTSSFTVVPTKRLD